MNDSTKIPVIEATNAGPLSDEVKERASEAAYLALFHRTAACKAELDSLRIVAGHVKDHEPMLREEFDSMVTEGLEKADVGESNNPIHRILAAKEIARVYETRTQMLSAMLAATMGAHECTDCGKCGKPKADEEVKTSLN